jgi:hypothetical protein
MLRLPVTSSNSRAAGYSAVVQILDIELERSDFFLCVGATADAYVSHLVAPFKGQFSNARIVGRLAHLWVI